MAFSRITGGKGEWLKIGRRRYWAMDSGGCYSRKDFTGCSAQGPERSTMAEDGE
jgi:hypothetical protein